MATKIAEPSPPETIDREGGSRWVELMRAPNDIDCNLLTGWLHEAGIETRTVKDRSAPGAWLYGGSNPWAPVTIMVRNWQMEEAKVALAELSYEAPSVEPPVPSEPPRRGWRFPVVWWIVALVLGALLTGVALARTASSMWHCDLPLLCSQSAPSDR
ncbi:MAG: DUF2007 domain-containing protein [Actinomycetota bacterium]